MIGAHNLIETDYREKVVCSGKVITCVKNNKDVYRELGILL
jgi:3-deoxy-D-manno-octulosonic-acid transferase